MKRLFKIGCIGIAALIGLIVVIRIFAGGSEDSGEVRESTPAPIQATSVATATEAANVPVSETPSTPAPIQATSVATATEAANVPVSETPSTPAPIQATSVATATEAANVPVSETPSTPPVELVEGSIGFRIQEQNTVWWKFAYQFTLRNNTDRQRSLNHEIKFVDSDGFVVDDATAYDVVVPADGTVTHSDSTLIDASEAGSVTGIQITEAANVPVSETPSTPPVELVEGSLGFRIQERNTVWWKFAYQFTLRNNTDRQRSLNLEIKFVDSDGFVVDDATAYDVVVPADGTVTHSDSTLIDASEAGSVTGIQIKER